MLAALRVEAAELSGQLSAAQVSLGAKDGLIQQLKGMVGGGSCAGDAAGVGRRGGL